MKQLCLVSALLAALPALADTLTLYTSQPNQDAQKTVDAFMQAHPEIEVEWLRDGTSKLMTKLQAELHSGIVAPDVLLIADSLSMEALKKDNRLLAYRSPEADNFEADVYDQDGYYYGTKLITTGIAYHSRAPQQPQSWQDLSRPEYANLLAMPSPLYSGAALIHVAALINTPDLGWDYLQALATNKAAAQGGNGAVLKAVASGQKPYGVMVDYLALREAEKGAPIHFVFPSEGVSVVTEPVAIMQGGKNPEAAKKFVDFLLSAKGQALAAEMGYLPARSDVPAPAYFPPREQIRFLPFAAAAAAAEAEAHKARFAELFGRGE